MATPRDSIRNSMSTLDSMKPLNAPHNFALVHFGSPTWCKFCTKFIWGLGKQGYCCSACKYPVHKKCWTLVPNNCPKQEIIDPMSKKSIHRHEYENMIDLVRAMMDPINGLEIKDRKVLLKTYPNCFVGREAVDWFLKNLPVRDREEAVEMGNKLRSSLYIKCATDQSKKFKDNDNIYYFEELDRVPKEQREHKLAQSSNVPQPEVTPDDFEVLQTVGRGGFGKVMKVMKKDNKKIYAMKVVSKTKISGERQLQCLIAEKNIMLNDNPFLVHLHYSFQTTDQLYFVMDFITGGDLAFHLSTRGRFSEREVRFIVAEIVLALTHLHSCGIVYRDLKLENVLLDKDGHVCLTDFGLAKELESVSSTTKTVCGTPTYLAPEILLSQPYGNAVDWWSLGVVMYELFTGSNPFDAEDFDTVISNILHKAIVVSPDLISDTARELMEALLQRVASKRMCSGPTGSAEIRNHEFFKSIDWDKLMVKALKAPFIPPKSDENFDKELAEGEQPKGKGVGQNLQFDNFTYIPKGSVVE